MLAICVGIIAAKFCLRIKSVRKSMPDIIATRQPFKIFRSIIEMITIFMIHGKPITITIAPSQCNESGNKECMMLSVLP